MQNASSASNLVRAAKSIFTAGAATLLATFAIGPAHALPSVDKIQNDRAQGTEYQQLAVTCGADPTVTYDAAREPVLLIPDPNFSEDKDALIDVLVKAGHTTCVVHIPKDQKVNKSSINKDIFEIMQAMVSVHGDKISVVTINAGAHFGLAALNQSRSAAHVIKDFVAIAPDEDHQLHHVVEQTLPAGLAYTMIVSMSDPQWLNYSLVSSLTVGGAPLDITRVQDVCGAYLPEVRALVNSAFTRSGPLGVAPAPLDVTSISPLMTLAADPVAQALTLDALAHDGGARPSRVNQRICHTEPLN
ncbi:hypothetical protein [Hoyosella rhizosphaerae]|uniref:hypothetical protein n=1 Tax=Hoyosella rhizosphaerae TaxID=1755582 RepID=UPI00166B30A3|nr:hypothetical protein [Hoyosella rhizosphaerae]